MAWYNGKHGLSCLAERTWNLALNNSRFGSLWVTVLMLSFSGTPWSSSLSTMLEVIIELTAADSNIPIHSTCSPIFTICFKWNDFEQYKAPPIILCRGIAQRCLEHLQSHFDCIAQQQLSILWDRAGRAALSPGLIFGSSVAEDFKGLTVMALCPNLCSNTLKTKWHPFGSPL